MPEAHVRSCKAVLDGEDVSDGHGCRGRLVLATRPLVRCRYPEWLAHPDVVGSILGSRAGRAS